MASLTAGGSHVVARWKNKTYEVSAHGTANRTEYALRSDGVLLRNTTFLKENGRVDFSTGWKIRARHTKSGSAITPELVDKMLPTYERTGR